MAFNMQENAIFNKSPYRGRGDTPGGGGGTQIWFRRRCAAEAAKPVPIFKGHFGGKGYPLLRVFSQENYVFVYFSDEITKVGGMFKDFQLKTIPYV